MTSPAPWFDVPAPVYFALVAGLIGGALIVVLRPLLRSSVDLTRRHDWPWSLMIMAILAAGRWPIVLFPRELNPDEGQLLAGAHTLVGDPVFWRSVDGSTAGPMDFFALWPAGGIFGWDSYFPARFTAMALIGLCLLLTHQVLSLLFGRDIARLATLGTVCLEALTNSMDLLHYSTEIVPITLLAGAAYACTRRWLENDRLLWNGLGGALLGALPLAKLQCAPLGFCLGVGWVLAEWFTPAPDRWQRWLTLCGGALFPLLLFALQLTLAGEWEHAITPYILYNLHYSQTGAPSTADVWTQMLKFSIMHDSLLHLWLPVLAGWTALMIRLRRPADRSLAIFTVAAGLGVLLAFFSVSLPGRAFLHYCQLLIVPLTLFLGGVIAWLLKTSPAEWRRREQLLVALGLLLLVAPMLYRRATSENFVLRTEDAFGNRYLSQLTQRIKPHVRPGDNLAIWGWSNYVYVETGLAQGTRDPHIEKLAQPGPHQEYFRRIYLEDFLNHLPVFFLDSVGPYSLRFQQEEYFHERQFPALAAVIAKYYVLIEQEGTARLYQRRDLLNR